MIDPMVVILAPPAAVFGWIAYELRRDHGAPATEEVPAAAVTVNAATS